MKEHDLTMVQSDMAQFLGKPSADFNRLDIIKYVENFNIKMINFRYVGEDGKLKTLNFSLNSREHLESILTFGERVDGSSLFSFIDAGSSDLYVIPRYSTAFVNPFSQIPAIDILCSFYTHEGKPLENSPEYILKKAVRKFKEDTGFDFKALGELEFYVNSRQDDLFIGEDQRGYHNAAPYCKWEELRIRALELIVKAGGKVKYGHSEVGNFSKDGEAFEQHEIEFLPTNAVDAADQLVIAKWILRMLAAEYGVEISFAPKISVGKAGSGLHIHMLLERDGVNMMLEGGKLSDSARSMIAGILNHAETITAFGNTIPTSYLRLVPNQEAPTRICWGDRNRSVLIRVPLGWDTKVNMANLVNPQEKETIVKLPDRQTVEYRAADGSADVYNLLAALIVTARTGLLDPGSVERSKTLYVNDDIFKNPDKRASLGSLPLSCIESAEALEKKRNVFEEGNIFPSGHLDNIIRKLKSYDDRHLSEQIEGDTEKIRELVLKYIHVM